MKAIAILFTVLALSSFGVNAQQSKAYYKLVKMGMDDYNAANYLQSAKEFSQAFATDGGKAVPGDRYNAACSWALAGHKDSAFYHLQRLAKNKQFTIYDHIIADSVFISLHADKRWAPLCGQIKQNKEKAEAHFNKPLVAMLDSVLNDDQQYREKLMEVSQKFGDNSEEARALWKTISEKDSINLVKVEKVIKKYGWLGPDIIGENGNATLFLVIQHADIKAQEKYLPLMRLAVKNKKARPADLALLEDRVALRDGRKQIYGSQVRSDATGAYWVSPLEDPDNVDKRRAKVGLPPLADYLQQWNIKWDVEEYKKQLPQIEKKEKG